MCDEVLLFSRTFFSWFYLHFALISLFISFNNSSDYTMLLRFLWGKLEYILMFLSELIHLKAKQNKNLALTNFLNSYIDLSRSNQSATITFQINLRAKMSPRWLEGNNRPQWANRKEPVKWRQSSRSSPSVPLGYIAKECWWEWEKYCRRNHSVPSRSAMLALGKNKTAVPTWRRHKLGQGMKDWRVPGGRQAGEWGITLSSEPPNRPCHHRGTSTAVVVSGHQGYKLCSRLFPSQAPPAVFCWWLSTGQGVDWLTPSWPLISLLDALPVRE